MSGAAIKAGEIGVNDNHRRRYRPPRAADGPWSDVLHDFEAGIRRQQRATLAFPLMFFYSDTDPAIWGANLPGSPVLGIGDCLEHLTQFVITTQRWVDGSHDLSSSPTHVHQ